MRAARLAYLASEAALILLFAYVVLLGGGFPALVSAQIHLYSTVIAAVVLGGWLIARIVRRERLPYSGIGLGLFAFIASQLIATVFSEDIRRSIPTVVAWLVYAIVFYFVLDLLRRGWPAEMLEKAMLIAGAIVLALALYELAGLFISWREFAGLEFSPPFKQRISGILGDPNLLAAFSNLLLPLALARALVSKGAGRVLLFGFVAMALVALWFTDSRGGLLGFAGGLGMLALLWVVIVSAQAKQRVLSGWQYLVARKALLAGILMAVVVGVGFVAWRFISFEGDTTHAPALEARDIYWQAAINAVSADPVTGAGPGMYPVQLMKIWSTPPARPYFHAHSAPFQVAAESGMIGLAALGLLIFLAVQRARLGWQWLDLQHRARRVAACAALVGLCVHSLVDDFFLFPAVGLIAMVLLAFVVPPQPPKAKAGAQPAWLLAPGVAALVFAAFTLPAHLRASNAVEAGDAGNWHLAASEMQTAAQSDDSFGFYWLQLGYALVRADEYEAAAVAYERGLGIEPVYSLNYANLGVMHWSHRELEQAHEQLLKASSLAPESALIALNLGLLEEELGLPSANEQLVRALELDPRFAGASIWRTTPVRESAFAQYVSSSVISEQDEAVQRVAQARAYMAQGDLEAAQDELVQAYALNDQSILVYVGLAELAFAQGDLDLAQAYVDAALWVQTVSNHDKVEAVLLSAEIALARGETELAMQRYEAAYRGVLSETSYGWGAAGWSPYAWFVFQRAAFAEDLLPMKARADISMDIAERLMVLADLYEESGRPDDAATVRASLADYSR